MQDHTTNDPQSQLTKRCPTCKERKPATNEFFSVAASNRDGLNTYCKICSKERTRVYREANADEVRRRNRERQRAAYKANPEKVKAQVNEWKSRNKDKVLKRIRDWQEANPEKVRSYKKKNQDVNRGKYNEAGKVWRKNNPDKEMAYRKANAEKHKAYAKEWYANITDEEREQRRRKGREYSRRNKEKVAGRSKAWRERNPYKARAILLRRRARKRGLPDTLTAIEWQACLDYFNGCCAACGDQSSLFNVIEMDHFVPLSSPECKGTVRENMIPLCASCNRTKSSRDALEWATERFGTRKGKQFIAKVEAYFASLSDTKE